MIFYKKVNIKINNSLMIMDMFRRLLGSNNKGLESRIIDKDDSNPNRPAWLRYEGERLPIVKFTGSDGTLTIYENPRRLPGYLRPTEHSDAETMSLYSKIAPDYDAMNHDATILARFVRTLVENHNATNLDTLDLFSGTGLVAAEIADLCSSIDLIDISQEMIEEAKKKPQLQNANFMVEDAIKVPSDKNYGLIVCSYGFHYVKNEEMSQFVERLSHIQKEGGIFINLGRFSMHTLSKYYTPLESTRDIHRERDRHRERHKHRNTITHTL